jgi:hypothetical protein
MYHPRSFEHIREPVFWFVTVGLALLMVLLIAGRLTGNF